MTARHLEQAAEFWTQGEPLKAGELIYANLPHKQRPRWAANVLRLVLERSRVDSPLFVEVLAAAEDDAKWNSGHRIFSALRDETLKLETMERTRGLTTDQQQLRFVLSLAELVAKVVYNATLPPDEFDEDSGWWIAASLRGFVDLWRDEEFAEAAWSTLIGQDE